MKKSVKDLGLPQMTKSVEELGLPQRINAILYVTYDVEMLVNDIIEEDEIDLDIIPPEEVMGLIMGMVMTRVEVMADDYFMNHGTLEVVYQDEYGQEINY